MIGKTAALVVVVLGAGLVGGAAPSEGAYPGPNGRIVFQRGGGIEHGGIEYGQANLWIVNADGSGLVWLTRAVGRDGQATWSPDGSRIAFESTRHGDADVFAISPDGSRLQQLTFS